MSLPSFFRPDANAILSARNEGYAAGYIAGLQAAVAICREREAKYLNGEYRRQHRHGAGLGASICADEIEALALRRVAMELREEPDHAR